MIGFLEDKYIDRFVEDEKNINYKYIEVPIDAEDLEHYSKD